MQKARWSTAMAAAALFALPVVGSAQSTQSPSQQNPPAQSQPPASTSPQQSTQQPPATTAQPPTTAAAAQSGQLDAAAAKQHLSEARDTLSQITSMPEAAKLQGPARTQVSQLISDFNALITTQADWRSSYAKVDSDLNALLGPEAGDQTVGTSGSTAATAGATGTAGTTGAAGGAAAPAGAAGTAGNAQIDPAIRAKLVEFRTHLNEFDKAAGGSSSASPAPASTTSEPAASASAGSSGSMPPAAATGTTANPANPAQNPTQSPTQSTAGEQPRPTGTSGVSSSSPTAGMTAADRERASHEVNTADRADAQKELDAISAILDRSKTGSLTKAQTSQLKQHIEALRSILARQ